MELVNSEYDIDYDNVDNGTIIKTDDAYSYVNGEYEFDFEAYYLEGYAPCDNLLILWTNKDSILFASIDMLENSLTYVWKNGNIINQYTVEGINCVYTDCHNSSAENAISYSVVNLEEDYELYVALARTNTWFTGYTAENLNPLCLNDDSLFEETNRNSRAATTISFFSNDDKAVSAANMTVGFYFKEKYLYTVGCYSGKVKNTEGDVVAAYVVETYYDDVLSKYISMIATWKMNHEVIQSLDGSCLQAIGSFQKEYNLFIEYDPTSNTAQVMLAPASSTYVITRDFATMFRLYGEHNYAYIGEYAFEVYAGGDDENSNSLITSIGSQILGARVPLYSTLSSIFVNIKDVLTALQNYNYSQVKKAYEITNNSTVNYAKSVAATYNSTLYKKHSMLSTRAIIYNYPRTLGSMYYQVEFDVLCVNNTSIKHHVRIVSSESVEFER